MNRLLQIASVTLARPYIWRELPGWGRLFHKLVGDYRSDSDWAWMGRKWIKGKLHGYEVLLDMGQWSNRTTYFLGRLYDLPTQLLLQRSLKAGDVFLDVGANEGAISLLASRLVGSQGRVIAIEPNPRPRSVFQAAIDRNSIRNIDLLPIGLGQQNETLEMSVPNANSGEGTFGKSNYESNEIEKITCDVKPGDTVVGDQRIAMIKIDVEGFELSVLRGIDKTIRRDRPPVVMEMIAGHLLNCGTSPREIDTFMTDLGYRPYRLDLKKSGLGYELDLKAMRIEANVDADVLWIVQELNSCIAA